MANYNLVNRGKYYPKYQSQEQQEVKKLTETKKSKYNFKKMFMAPRNNKNMGMDCGFSDSMFGECRL